MNECDTHADFSVLSCFNLEIEAMKTTEHTLLPHPATAGGRSKTP